MNHEMMRIENKIYDIYIYIYIIYILFVPLVQLGMCLSFCFATVIPAGSHVHHNTLRAPCFVSGTCFAHLLYGGSAL